MTDPSDGLIEELAAADPVAGQVLPSAQDPRARQLLENSMSSESFPPATESVGSVDEPARLLDLPEIPRSTPSGRGRGRVWLVGSAAAVVLLIAGFLVLAPDNTEPALAAVQGAAQATADTDTGRITTVFSLDGTDGTTRQQLSGQLEASFAGSDIALSVELDEAIGTSGLGAIPVSDARLVDGVFYANDNGQWYAVDTGGFIGQTLVDLVDPRSMLATVQGLLDTEEIGTATVDGVTTTHFRSVVDLGDETLAESGWLPVQGVEIDADGEVVVDLYVDETGLLRRLDLTGEVREPGDGSGTASFTVSTSFQDIGAAISVEAPADAIEVNPLDGVDSSQLFESND